MDTVENTAVDFNSAADYSSNAEDVGWELPGDSRTARNCLCLLLFTGFILGESMACSLTTILTP